MQNNSNTIEPFDKYDILDQYEQLLNNYTSQLFYDGLDENDFHEISYILENLQKMKIDHFFANNSDNSYLKKIDEIIEGFKTILEDLELNVIESSLSKTINNIGSLLHLVYTNNKYEKITMYSYNSYRFLCQFHNERKPSLGITESKGVGYCFGCSTSLNSIYYIQNYENFTFNEAVALLAKVYLININNNPFDENDPIVLKYRNSLLSDEYKKLLEKGYERIKKAINFSGNITLGQYQALEKINKDLELIERIKNNKYKNFRNNKEKEKKLNLEMPNFD